MAWRGAARRGAARRGAARRGAARRGAARRGAAWRGLVFEQTQVSKDECACVCVLCHVMILLHPKINLHV